jgi:hypothetical protein
VKRQSVEMIVSTLNAAGVRYLIVGGLAVVAHGFTRFTADVDLVLDPDPAGLRRAIGALTSLGYTPRAPVPFADFEDPDKRARWIRDKGMTDFSAFSREHPATEIDLFVEPPFDFEQAFSRAVRFEVAPGVEATFVGRADLIEMKRLAGRPQDLEDIAGLEASGSERGQGLG